MSDILIKDMEIPKGDIPLVIIINSDGSVEEIDGSDEINATDAKAIELPPHGRLGDLDKVANRMHRYAMACRKNEDPERAELWMYAEEEVRLQGTVVEASTEEKSNGTDN